MGKTKPAIDEMMELWMDSSRPPPSILVAVPTEEMRDVNWPDEVEKWYGEHGRNMWDECVNCVCYASLHQYRASSFNFVVLDEGHHLTQLSVKFFNVPVDTMLLTATYPRRIDDPDKWTLLNSIAPLVFTYPLDQGVEDGIVAPFEFHVIKVPLDRVHHNIEHGPAGKKKMTTEAHWYGVLSNSVKKLYSERKTKAAEMLVMRRRMFICNLPSKEKMARVLIEKLCDQPIDGGVTVRTLIFFGSIKQADLLMGERVYHSKKKARKGQQSALDLFREEKIHSLGVVSAVNEGINIPNVDQEIIVQMNSDPRILVQRVNKPARLKPL